MTIYTAHYWTHEGNEFQTRTQEFIGRLEDIPQDYYRIYGDRLAWLKDEDGTTVYDNSEEVLKYVLDNMGWIKV